MNVTLEFTNGTTYIDLGNGERVPYEPGWVISCQGSVAWAPAREWRRSARWSTPEQLALIHESLTVYTFGPACRVIEVAQEGGMNVLRYAR